MEPVIRILVIDDDEEEYILIRELFRTQTQFPPESFYLEYAQSIAMAMEKLADGNWDFFIIDYQLGGSTGLDFLIEARSAGVDVAALLVTGMDDIAFPPGTEDLLDSGTVRFLHKKELTWHPLIKSIRDLIVRNIAILVVEDDPDDFQLVRKGLTEVGMVRFNVAWAQTLSEARRQIGAEAFDMVILDYRLGTEKGADLVADLEALDPVPFVLVCSEHEDVMLDPLFAGPTARGTIAYIHKSDLLSRNLAKYLLGANRLAAMVRDQNRVLPI